MQRYICPYNVMYHQNPNTHMKNWVFICPFGWRGHEKITQTSLELDFSSYDISSFKLWSSYYFTWSLHIHSLYVYAPNRLGGLHIPNSGIQHPHPPCVISYPPWPGLTHSSTAALEAAEFTSPSVTPLRSLKVAWKSLQCDFSRIIVTLPNLTGTLKHRKSWKLTQVFTLEK